MFDKSLKQLTLGIGQHETICGYIIGFMGKINTSTCVFNCPGWSTQQIYVPIDGVFYSGNTKVKILKITDQDVTLGWEG